MGPSNPAVSQMPRLVDLLLAGSLTLLLAPVYAAIALAVRLEGRAPVLYRESRLGRGGQPFELLKFGTLASSASTSRRVVPPGDPAVTRLGRLLRRTHLDELPQLLAVVRGAMSLVGPRPERADVWAGIEPGLRARLQALRPGMTSPASLRYLCEDSVLGDYPDAERLYREVLLPARLHEDLRYFESRTLAADLGVLMRTLTRVWLDSTAHERCRQRVRDLLATRARCSAAGGEGGQRA